MNFYEIFYWMTVADSIKTVSAVLAVVFGIYFIIATIAAFGGFDSDDWSEWKPISRVIYFWFSVIFIFSLFSWILVPKKKDILIIIAGGAVGEFITSDKNAKQIPSEVMLLLRSKIKEEISEANLKSLVSDSMADTLKDKSKEELIELLKKK